MDKAKVLDQILSSKVIAVIRMKDAGRLSQVAGALLEGGIKALEVTMTVPGAASIIREMARSKAPGTLVGGGTVMDAEKAKEIIAAGADFIVSPVADGATIEVCREAGVLIAPGAFTPTEIAAAWRAGADIVKVFPATSLGPQFFKDLRGPMPAIRMMPTGGVTLENTRAYMEAGACCVGIGTALLDKKIIEAEDWRALAERARKLSESIRVPRSA